MSEDLTKDRPWFILLTVAVQAFVAIGAVVIGALLALSSEHRSRRRERSENAAANVLAALYPIRQALGRLSREGSGVADKDEFLKKVLQPLPYRMTEVREACFMYNEDLRTGAEHLVRLHSFLRRPWGTSESDWNTLIEQAKKEYRFVDELKRALNRSVRGEEVDPPTIPDPPSS
jgi:hypothetical protein